MLHLHTDIEVHISHKKIYDFLIHLDKEKYCLWHPLHRDFKTIKASRNLNGTIFYFCEALEGKDTHYYWTLVAHEPNRFIQMKAKSIYPLHLSIALERTSDDSTMIRHRISIGFQHQLLAPCLDGLVSKTFFRDKVKKLQQNHIIEEYKNLEKIWS